MASTMSPTEDKDSTPTASYGKSSDREGVERGKRGERNEKNMIVNVRRNVKKIV